MVVETIAVALASWAALANPAGGETGRPVPPSPQLQASSGAGRQGGAADSMVGVQADVGGFLMEGPSVSVEVGNRVAFVGRVRALALGALRHVTAGNNKVSPTEYGAGASLRFYTGSDAHRQGFYVGPTVEYISTEETEGDDSLPTGVTIEYRTKAIVGGVDLGYRWVLANRMTLGLGGILGYYHPLEKKTVITGGYASGWRNEAKDMVVPLLVAELGFAL